KGEGCNTHDAAQHALGEWRRDCRPPEPARPADSAHISLPMTALISARMPAAARDGLRSKRIARLTEMRHEAGSPFQAARTEADTSPPCAPIPGMRNGSVEALRTSTTADGAVAPTTRPTLPWPLARSAIAATRRNMGAPAAAPSIRSGSGSSPTQSIVRRSLESARSRSKKGINGNGKWTSPPDLPTWWGGECSHTHPASPHGGEGNLRIELDAAGTAGRAGPGQPHRGRSRRQCQADHRPHQGGPREGRRRGVLPRAGAHGLPTG